MPRIVVSRTVRDEELVQSILPGFEELLSDEDVVRITPSHVRVDKKTKSVYNHNIRDTGEGTSTDV